MCALSPTSPHATVRSFEALLYVVQSIFIGNNGAPLDVRNPKMQRIRLCCEYFADLRHEEAIILIVSLVPRLLMPHKPPKAHDSRSSQMS